ncbi:type III-A CRISPR-associated protein Csm2 [Chloroflexota bacterium]
MIYNRPPSQPSLPQGYLKDGYFDKDGNILDDVITRWPQHLANTFPGSRPPLKIAQLRNFYREVRRQEGRLTSGIPFASLRTEILKLDSHAQNALKKNNAPVLFRNFIGQNVRLASMDEKSFKAFVTHFECIVGYYPDTK